VSKQFVAAHLDPVMKDSIIFGPGYLTKKESEQYTNSCENFKDLISILEDKKLIGKDRHIEGSADTYNRTWSWKYPFGYNFSVIKSEFDVVGGFPSYRRWGHEEIHLCKKIVEKFNTPVKSNKYAIAIHLWHPVVNHSKTDVRKDDVKF
jgi:hypothetical protein